MIVSPQTGVNCSKQRYDLHCQSYALRTARTRNSRTGHYGLCGSRHDATLQAQHPTRATAVAVSDADVLPTSDPALDSLIDRWLSNSQASTSAADGSSSNGSTSYSQALPGSNGSAGLLASAVPAALWDAVLGPVSVTLDSLSTLEDGDELFVLSDSLCHVASSLQELQALAEQLQQQPDAAVKYSGQLVQLLKAAEQQAESLQDTVLLNLLAIAAVLLTSAAPSSSSSSTARSAVQSAAVAAVKVTLSELWQRPDAAAGLDGVQLTSLSIVLYRLSKLGLTRQVPSTLLASAFEQLQQQASSLTPSQLAVCFWCLSSSKVAPPAAAVVAVLESAAGALAARQMEDVAVLRMNAALLNIRGYLGAAGAPVCAVKASRLHRVTGEFAEAAAQHATQQLTSSSFCSSSKGVVTAGKVVVSVAQLCGTYGCGSGLQQQQQQLLQAVVDALLAVDSSTTASSSSSRAGPEVIEAARAAGYMLPHWQHALPPEQQQQAVQAVFSWIHQQRQPSQQAGMQWSSVQAFLDAAVHASVAAGDCKHVLDLTAQQLQAAPGLQQQQASGVQAEAASAADAAMQCHGLLLRVLVAAHHAPPNLPALCAAVAEAAAAVDSSSKATAAAAAAHAAVALCTLQPEGWQQKLQQLEGSLGLDVVAQLPSRSLQVATAAYNAGPAAVGTASAALQHLLQPLAAAGMATHHAAELLLLLSDVLADSMQHGNQGSAAAPADAGAVLQQCLRCMLLLQQNARGLLPSQVVPLLSSLLQLQQLHQQSLPQQQQQQQPGLHWQLVLEQPGRQIQQQVAFAQLHLEVLAAVALQLEDSARYLSAYQLSESVRLLALMQSRPTLALAAVAATASGRTEQFMPSQLVWLLWGLTKLRFTRERGFTRMLKAAVQQAVQPPPATAAAEASDANEQQQQQEEQQQQQQDGDVSLSSSSSSSNSSAVRSAAAAAASMPLHQLAALLWVAACRGYQGAELALLLDQILGHPEAPKMPHVSTVAWSFAHMVAYDPHQQQLQQLRQRVVDWVDRCCSSSSSNNIGNAESGAAVPIRSVINITWALNKLGHTPSQGAQALLLTAALEQQQLMSPPELSCFVYCLGSWGHQPLSAKQLQQLEEQLQAALQQQQSSGSSSNGGSTVVNGWDGPALCSCCWGLINLGHVLQHDTLQLVELHLQALMPAAPTVTSLTTAQTASGTTSANTLSSAAAAGSREAGLAASNGSSSSSSSSSTTTLPGASQLAAPSARDLAMFGAACRQSRYRPSRLMAQFRSWLLLQLAAKGPAALLKLTAVASAATRTAPAAPRHSSAAAEKPLQQQQQQQQQGGGSPAAGVAAQYANVLVCVVMLLRQLQFADADLLQQLEAAAAGGSNVLEQLTGQQLVMVLSSFRQLGHFPGQWWASGLRKQLQRQVQQLQARDCVELLEVLAAWKERPGVGSSTAMRQRILPQLVQRLLGQVWVPKKEAAAAAGSGSNTGSSSSSSSRSSSPEKASIASATTRSGSSSSDSDSEGEAPAPAKGSSGSDSSPALPAGEQTAAAGTNMVARLSGPQVVSLLRCISQLGIDNKLLQRQALKRLQQVWASLDPAAQIAAAHAAVRLNYDATGLLNVQSMVEEERAGSPPLQQQQQQQVYIPGAASVVFGTASAASRTVWIFGNLGKHPGAGLLGAGLSAVAEAAAASSSSPQQQQQYQLLPLREVSNALYAAAVLHELSHPAAVAMLQQLQAAAAAGQLLSHPLFTQQAPQLAACLLVSQVAAPSSAAAGAVAAAPTRPNSDTQSPSQRRNAWLGLSREVQQRLLEGWRRKVILKAQKRPHRLQQEVVLCLRQLGLRCKANAVTPDGCVCIDVAATSPQGDVLAIELLGPHNAASNTQRPLGPARIKWRLLAARGYRVIVINTWQWRSLEGPTRSRDGGDSDMGVRAPGAEVFSEKLLFLQSRLAGPIAAAVTAATAAEGAVQAAAGRVQGPGDPSPAASLEVQDGAGADTSSSSSVEAGSGGRGRVWPELQRPVRPQQSQVVKQVQQQVRQAMQQQQ